MDMSVFKKFRMRPVRCLLICVFCTFVTSFVLAAFLFCDASILEKLQDICNDPPMIGNVPDANADSDYYENTGNDLELERLDNDEDEITSKDGHKMALIVPFRDRLEELFEFAPYMHSYLKNKSMAHTIYVINQLDNYRFNRASLINIGFIESSQDCDYIAMHDVDLLPLHPDLDYSYPVEGPFHVAAPNLHPLYHYNKFIGGILLINEKHFRMVNGMSNRYWGWGREDDEFYVRIKRATLKIRRPENITSGFKTFKHLHNKKKRQRDNKRYFNQSEKTRRLDKETGLGTVKYEVDSVRKVTIDHAPVTFINVVLSCDITQTPWCLKPEDQKILQANNTIS